MSKQKPAAVSERQTPAQRSWNNWVPSCGLRWLTLPLGVQRHIQPNKGYIPRSSGGRGLRIVATLTIVKLAPATTCFGKLPVLCRVDLNFDRFSSFFLGMVPVNHQRISYAGQYSEDVGRVGIVPLLRCPVAMGKTGILLWVG